MAMKKYGPVYDEVPTRHRQHFRTPEMDLDHFVCACISIQEMSKLYDICTSADQQPQVSKDDFLRVFLALP